MWLWNSVIHFLTDDKKFNEKYATVLDCFQMLSQKIVLMFQTLLRKWINIFNCLIYKSLKSKFILKGF